MRILLAVWASGLVIGACAVDQEPDYVASPQSVSAPANGAQPAQVTPNNDDDKKTKVGVRVDRDGGGVTVENDRLDIEIGNE